MPRFRELDNVAAIPLCRRSGQPKYVTHTRARAHGHNETVAQTGFFAPSEVAQPGLAESMRDLAVVVFKQVFF